MTNIIIASLFIIAMVITIIVGLTVACAKKYNKEIKDPCLHSFWENGKCKECGLLDGYEWKEIKGVAIGAPVPNMITKVEYKDGKKIESLITHEHADTKQ